MWHFNRYIDLTREAANVGQVANGIFGAIVAGGRKTPPYAPALSNVWSEREEEHIARKAELLTEREAFTEACDRLRKSQPFI
jgi:hypothetical protein